MSRNLENEILSFVEKLPYWQQYLSAYIFNQIDLDEEAVIEEAFQHLLSEEKLSPNIKDQPTLGLPLNTDKTETIQAKNMKLVSIKDLVNVNAVRPNQELPIGPKGITVVFGLNGAGKSSMTRILNSAFYSRGECDILPNILQAPDDTPASAKFIFQKEDGTTQEIQYSVNDTKKHPEFEQFASFDTTCVNIHLNQENELHVAPRGFQFFKQLADYTTKVNFLLINEVDKRKTDNPFISHLDGDSPTKVWVQGLSSATDTKTIEEKTLWTPEKEHQTKEIEKAIEELNVVVVQTKKKQLEKIKTQLTDIENRWKNVQPNFTETNLVELKNTIETITKLTKVVQQNGVAKFQHPNINDIGAKEWKELIVAAQNFAQKQHEHYPSGTDICILCAQDLDEKARQRLQDYWKMLQSDSEEQLRTAKNRLVELNTMLGMAEEQPVVIGEECKLWLKENQRALYDNIVQNIQDQQTAISSLKDSVKTLEWKNPHIPNHASLEATKDSLEEQIQKLDTKKLGEEKEKLSLSLIDLKHTELMSSKKKSIEEWVKQQKWVETATEIKKGVSTKNITDTGKDLFDQHVTKLYRQTFHQECQDLNARFKLSLAHKGKGGRSHRKYNIEGYPPGKILSEGEQRAVSLADFITELKISNINSGWVFDDPVNSQDIERKELIAKKLVEESENRQVIIFTHDITFHYDLKNICNELEVPFKSHWIERQGFEAGIIHRDVEPNFEKSYIQPTRAEDKLREAKNPDLNPLERENRLREGFASLRTSYETFVVHGMLNKVVTRFDRKISYKLEEIYAPQPWLRRVSIKLGKLSAFVDSHSHSDIGYKPPTIERLAKEIQEFKDLKLKFKKEKKAALSKERQPKIEPTLVSAELM